MKKITFDSYIENIENEINELECYLDDLNNMRCKKHPKYKAMHPPKVKCNDCEVMYCHIHNIGRIY